MRRAAWGPRVDLALAVRCHRLAHLSSTSEQSAFSQTEIIGTGPKLSSYHKMLCEKSAAGAAGFAWSPREVVEDANCQAGV